MKEAFLSFAGVSLIRALRATVRLRHHGDGPMREMEKRGEHFILALWHRHLLLMPYSYRGNGISVLVSQSRDGELIARALARMGIGTSRGSSSRGGIAGMRDLLRKAAQGYDLAFTPDGPRGPAGEVQPGVILAAAATGLPILSLSLAATKVKRLRSWDRFVVPLPLSTVHIVYGEPFTVERRGDPELAAAELKRRLDAGEKEAERLAKEN
ncbi:MAG TPA: lysophospholipid acyltransferase family protein [Thermoanaerobaculia bacterium]|nr:lysophospholipid acyltransferase family protein [Thermoanaerobaculia bacterium]